MHPGSIEDRFVIICFSKSLIAVELKLLSRNVDQSVIHPPPHIKMDSTYQIAVSILTVLLVLAGSYYAYDQGYMDPLIERLG